MANDNEVLSQEQTAEQVQQHQQPTIPVEVQQMMAISLNNGIEPTEKVVETETPQVFETQAPIVSFDTLKDKFNYQSAEDAIKEIEELRQLKSAPQVQEVAFENETSEKIFKLIQAGKVDEVVQVLNEQKKLDQLTTSDVTPDNAGDIIKLGMQFKYKDLTPDEINYKFNKQYAVPKQPVQTELEEADEYEQRLNEWKDKVREIEQEKIIDAKLIKPELINAKSKIVLPEIEQQVDEDYVQWQKSLEVKPEIEAQIQQEYKSFTPKTIETKIDFKDEANKIGFQFQYEPDEESFKKSVEMGLDINNFWEQFKKSDGTPDRQKFLKAIYLGLNADKVILEAMKQAKNATIKALIPSNDGNGNRQFAQTQEPSELAQMMERSLAPFVRR